jgi:hypothetical protein
MGGRWTSATHPFFRDSPNISERLPYFFANELRIREVPKSIKDFLHLWFGVRYFEKLYSFENNP